MLVGIIFLLILSALSFVLGIGYLALEIYTGKKITTFSIILVCSFLSTGCSALFAYLTWRATTDNDAKAKIYHIVYDIAFAVCAGCYVVFLYIRSAVIFKESKYKLMFIRIASAAAIMLMFTPHIVLLIMYLVSADFYETHHLKALSPAFIGGGLMVVLDIFYSFHFRNLILSKRTSEKMLLISSYGLCSCIISMLGFFFLTVVAYLGLSIDGFYQCFSLAVTTILLNSIVITVLKFKLEDKPVNEKADPQTKFKTVLKSVDLKTMNY